ncbi:hypothetical protein NSQ62_08075 [Solibacillus sp. FSL H8-0523]|uniref:hypothetical protein n=1 Tax=Solibacillus sp. FSL H8-0523 TaxID=2954511 RepID=UPI003100D865
MKKMFRAVITFKVKDSHPDIEYIKNPDETLSHEDVYTMNTDYFNNEDEMINYIKHDLSLVASGGYSYNLEHIKNVVFDIKRIATDSKRSV